MRDLLEDSVEKLFSGSVDANLLRAAEDGKFPDRLWKDIEEAGFAHALVPEDKGGSGASWHEAYALVRAIGHHGAPIPLGETLLGNWLLAQAGLDPVAGMLTVATSLDASRVPFARNAGHVVAIADGKVQLFTTPAATAKAQNVAREARDDLSFAGAKPVASAALPGHLPPDVILLGGAMIRAAQIAGAMDKVLDMSVRYANERVQFGRPIGKFQAIQHQLARFATEAAAVGMAADTAFHAADNGLSPFHIAVAKIRASEAAGLGASVAHAVHGAMGFTYEHSLHFLTRRLWSWRSEFGNLGYWSERLGRDVCANDEPLWKFVTAQDKRVFAA